MSDKVKLIIEIPKEDYLNAKRINWANVRPECVDDYEYQIAHGTPLDSNSERAEVQAYFDGQAYGWEQGRKALIDDVKAEIEKHQFSREYCSEHNIDTAIDMGMVRIILDNIGKGDSE